MKRLLIFLMLFVLLFTLAACNSIDYGTVIDKSFTPGHIETGIIPMRIGKTMVCMPRTRHIRDTWTIFVENEEGREPWNVSEEFYNSVEIGDTVDRR